LFPLNTVLFPKATLPLQIFEDRYKLMLRDCLQGDSSFGVVLIKSGSEVGEPAEPYSVGTVARITQVSEAGEGKIFVSAVGQQRFRIIEIVQTRPYISAEVELLEEQESTGQPDLPSPDVQAIRRYATRYVQLTLGLGGGWISKLRLPVDETFLSYYLPKLLQVEMPHKQALLEMPTTALRLGAEQAILEAQTPELHARLTKELFSKFARN
jgi:Lon protease-like protein